MRVRPPLPAEHRGRASRRPHVVGRPVDAPAGSRPSPSGDRQLRAERRHRASVAPEDRALYRCACGHDFAASVSTTVTCPSCGAAQAW